MEMTEEEFYEMERAEAQKHDDKIKELEAVTEKNSVIEEAYRKGYKAGQKDTFTTYNKEVTEMNNDYVYRLKCRDDEYAELKAKYDELNDFSNSQCYKLLKENQELKNKLNILKNYFGANLPDGVKVFEVLVQ